MFYFENESSLKFFLRTAYLLPLIFLNNISYLFEKLQHSVTLRCFKKQTNSKGNCASRGRLELLMSSM
jgi:hypothetical protein